MKHVDLHTIQRDSCFSPHSSVSVVSDRRAAGGRRQGALIHSGSVNRRPGALSSFLSLTSISAGSGSVSVVLQYLGSQFVVGSRQVRLSWWGETWSEEPERETQLKPGQRDGHSEIGDPPEAAAGGGQEPFSGEAPGGRGGVGDPRVECVYVGEGPGGEGTRPERMRAGLGLSESPGAAPPGPPTP